MPFGWKITLNGEDITSKVSRFSITAALESTCREMTLDIADPAFYATLDFSHLPETPEIEIFTKTGEDWISQGKFFIERPALDSTIKSDLLQGIWGRSLTARLGEPFAPKVSRLWDEKTTFFNICSEMCALSGISWDEAFSDIDDFVIYANAYEADSVYPIDVIAELAGFAGALVTTDRLGHLCIKRIDYSPSSEDFTITDADIAEISESPEWPTFGNRVRITPTGSLAGYSLSLTVPVPCLTADGASRTKLFAQVLDEAGVPVNDLVVNWSTDAAGADLDSATSNTQEILIRDESQRATNFYTITLDFKPSSVDGIYAYADHGRTNNFASAGYSLEGNTITLADKLDYCDQSLVISYRTRGMAVNYLQAGSVSEDVTVTADIEGETASADVFIDNPCECPPTITLKANPSSIHIGEASALLVYVEESGPVTAGRIVFMSEKTAVKRGRLSWTTARLGKVAIANEKSTVRNEVSGVSQCEISMFPASVSSVFVSDAEGSPTGSNLYSSHNGKLIDLSSTLASGTDLLVNYVAQGAALNHFNAESLGTARINACIITTREEPSEAYASVSIMDETAAVDSYPEDWNEEEDEYGGTGGDSDDWDEEAQSLCHQDNGTYVECPEGRRCCSDGMTQGCHPEEACVDGGAPFNWCVPDNVSGDPSESNLTGRFVDAMEHDCECQAVCEAEFDIFETTQNYDGASYRKISEIVVEDFGLTEGTPEYWEKFEELKKAAITACENMCLESNMVWDPDNPETINQSDEVAVSVIGGVAPYSWSVSGEGFSLGADETEDGTNLLIADGEACGGASISVQDSEGKSVTGSVRSTAGHWSGPIEGCILSGAPDTTTGFTQSTHLEKTEGRYYQFVEIRWTWHSLQQGGCGNCVAGESCLDWECFYTSCGSWCCSGETFECDNPDYKVACIYVSQQLYRVWEC